MNDKYDAWTEKELIEVRKQVHEGNAGRAYYGADWLDDMKLALGTIDSLLDTARRLKEALNDMIDVDDSASYKAARWLLTTPDVQALGPSEPKATQP